MGRDARRRRAPHQQSAPVRGSPPLIAYTPHADTYQDSPRHTPVSGFASRVSASPRGSSPIRPSRADQRTKHSGSSPPRNQGVVVVALVAASAASGSYSHAWPSCRVPKVADSLEPPHASPNRADVPHSGAVPSDLLCSDTSLRGAVVWLRGDANCLRLSLIHI